MLGSGEIDDDLGDGSKCFAGESGITTNELMELKRFTTHVGTSSPMGSSQKGGSILSELAYQAGKLVFLNSSGSEEQCGPRALQLKTKKSMKT